MNVVLKTFLSMSVSGGLLILILLFGKKLLKDKISRQWQYYIWMIVILRLLLPFGPEVNMLGKIYQVVDRAVSQEASLLRQLLSSNISDVGSTPVIEDNESVNSLSEDVATLHPLQDAAALLMNHIWLIWLMAALVLLIRKITIYQGFIRFIHVGMTPISDIEILNRLSIVAEQSGIKKPIELCVNPFISSPLLIGFFHPCIVLPGEDISEKDFQYIVLHELIHYKRRDMFYKWLVQVTVCLHWFNPLVYFMSREINRACEFSCDEAVLAKIECGSAQDYGNTLLSAMAAVERYRKDFGAVTLSGNKQLLRERLVVIMRFKKKSMRTRLLTGVLTLCIAFAAAFVGVYPVNATNDQETGRPQVTVGQDPTQGKTNTGSEALTLQTEQYYEAGSLPLFQITFAGLEEEIQDRWLDKIYTDDRIEFWGVAVGLLDEDCDLFRQYAERTYADGSITYFSTLAMHMSEDMLEEWLDRALEDEKWVFQSFLFKALERDDELDELEEKREKRWEEEQKEEYQAVGVTVDGKNYYYQGQLVNIFLDIRVNQSFWTLNMNPAGTVNIKISRDADNKITGVAYMTEAEVNELFGEIEAANNSDS